MIALSAQSERCLLNERLLNFAFLAIQWTVLCLINRVLFKPCSKTLIFPLDLYGAAHGSI